MDPIPGLGDVAWASLYGTYGSAADLPRHLEALRSPDSHLRGAALVELSDAVVHQGTRWQVSAHVVRFLVWLVDDPATPDRGALTSLLRQVGVGSRDDGDLPFDPGTAFAGPAVTSEQEDGVIEPCQLEEELTDDWADLADACAGKWNADAYRAAATHTDAYRRWLVDDDPEVASRAAELLAWFPPTRPTVAALLSADHEDAVRASANLTLAHLDGPTDTVVERMTSLLDSNSPLVRITAAITLAYRAGQRLPDAALSVLVDAKDHGNPPDFPHGWDGRAPRGYVSLALQRLGLG